MSRRFAPLAVSLALLAAGCGDDGSSDASSTLPVPLEREALVGLAFRDRELPADVLAADAFAEDELAAILESAGYEGGREREFTGHTTTFDHVIARTLRFSDASSAAAYLGWVAAHTSDLVGPTQTLRPLLVGDDAILVELEPCPTCKKQLPTLVAAWHRGGSVGYLVAAGRDVDRESIQRLVEAIDGSLAGSSS